MEKISGIRNYDYLKKTKIERFKMNPRISHNTLPKISILDANREEIGSEEEPSKRRKSKFVSKKID